MSIVEAGAGLALLIIPGLAVSTLLETPLETPGGIVAGRVAGAALTTLAVVCWNVRNGERGAEASGVVTAMLFYNVAAAAILVYAGIRLSLQSALIWPVIVLHGVLAACCLLNLRFTQRRSAAGASKTAPPDTADSES